MIISTSAEKAFEKIQHPFLIKALKKLEIEGIKSIYKKTNKQKHKHIANAILNWEKLNPILVKSGIRHGCPLFPLLFNTVFYLLATVITQGKK
jgi:endonuclease IV